ncbi:MAG: hypothetical protein MZV65_42855 [Chromatiales bacterium]|nr:hypothetical protein [Chromatiales bacterium]
MTGRSQQPIFSNINCLLKGIDMPLLYSVLNESLIGVRMTNGTRTHLSLPALFVALSEDSIRNFPALRPHQRHPWHAFLVQLAAIALNHANRTDLFAVEAEWRAALLALSPDDPDGAAWCLVTPPDRPALMQAPVPEGRLDVWKNRLQAPDELDMLVTSKNHDLKVARMKRSAPEDWLMALISLQTQEGFLGAGNYGVTRMNGGFANRPALGAVPQGGWGRRWARDVQRLLDARAEIVREMELPEQGGRALVWLPPGMEPTASLSRRSIRSTSRSAAGFVWSMRAIVSWPWRPAARFRESKPRAATV